MRKNIILLFIQVALCIICFFNNWFKDNLFSNMIFMVPILFNITLIVAFTFIYFYSFSKYKNKKLIFKISSLFLFFFTILVSVYDFRLLKTKIELNLYNDERMAIIEKINNNEFSYYYKGNIKLPIYKYVSSDGEVYVYQNDKSCQVVGFWIYRGIMGESIQLIYSPNEKIIYENLKDVSEIKKLKNKWYYVITK